MKPLSLWLDPEKPIRSTRSSSIERKINLYPSPKYHKMLVAYAYDMCEKKGECGTRILKKFFDSFPEPQQQKLLALFEKMSPAQKRWPGWTSKHGEELSI